VTRTESEFQHLIGSIIHERKVLNILDCGQLRAMENLPTYPMLINRAEHGPKNLKFPIVGKGISDEHISSIFSIRPFLKCIQASRICLQWNLNIFK
jgi:hypothetical protein